MSLYRDQAEILINLFNSRTPVGGNVLAINMGVGLKTLKKEIDIVNEYCEKNGCCIMSKTGEGYYLEVTDEELFSDFKDEINNKYYGNLYYRDEQSERVHYIIRLFLSNDSLLIDDIAGYCLCSVSTVNRDMKRVRDRLAQFKLELTKDSGHGLKLVGSEWHKRLDLIEEYMMYSEFESVLHFENENQINEMFMHNGVYINMLVERIEQVLKAKNYKVPYYAFDDLANMIILTITRKKYAADMDSSLEWFRNGECEMEKEIIKEIFVRLPILPEMELSEAELYALAIYLKSHKVIKYNESFIHSEGHEIVENVVEGFFDYLREHFDLKDIRMESLRKDLCCELYRIQFKLRYDIHALRYRASNFQREGLLALDLCTLLYLYLNQLTEIKVLASDILMFYYIFNSFTKDVNPSYMKKIVVISKLGFYISRGQASNLQTRCRYSDVKFVPGEYYNLSNYNMSEISGFMTDIDEMKYKYGYKPVYDLHFLRNEGRINQIVSQIIRHEYRDITEAFQVSDLYYPEDIKDYDDVENYIINNFIRDERKAEEFINEIRKKTSMFNLTRLNQFMIFNTMKDIFDESFVKVIILDNPIMYHTHYIDKILFYNIKGHDINRTRYFNKCVGKLLYAPNLVLNVSPEADYKLLTDIMFESR